MTTYNEEVRQYILDRYEELGHAAPHLAGAVRRTDAW